MSDEEDFVEGGIRFSIGAREIEPVRPLTEVEIIFEKIKLIESRLSGIEEKLKISMIPYDLDEHELKVRGE